MVLRRTLDQYGLYDTHFIDMLIEHTIFPSRAQKLNN